MVDDKLTLALIEKLVFPLIVGIVGWFVKDYLFAVYARRDELVRKEWERRLLEVWSPLYYWSGVVLMDGRQKGWDRHGLKELELVLSKSANLLPTHHYNNLIKLVQTLTDQKTSEANIDELKRTRQFVYKQVKTFNYLLYRRSGWFDATTYTDFFASAKYLIRFLSQALKHLIVWLLVVVLFWITYVGYVSGRYWIVVIIVAIVSVPILYDWYRQVRLHREISREGEK